MSKISIDVGGKIVDVKVNTKAEIILGALAEIGVGATLSAAIIAKIDAELSKMTRKVEGGFSLFFLGEELGRDESGGIVNEKIEDIVKEKFVEESDTKSDVNENLNLLIESVIETNWTDMNSTELKLEKTVQDKIYNIYSHKINTTVASKIENKEENYLDYLRNIKIKLDDIKTKQDGFFEESKKLKIKLEKLEEYSKKVHSIKLKTDMAVVSNDDITQLSNQLQVKNGFTLIE